MLLQEVVTATVDLEEVRAYRNNFRSRNVMVRKLFFQFRCAEYRYKHSMETCLLPFLHCCCYLTVEIVLTLLTVVFLIEALGLNLQLVQEISTFEF